MLTQAIYPIPSSLLGALHNLYFLPFSARRWLLQVQAVFALQPLQPDAAQSREQINQTAEVLLTRYGNHILRLAYSYFRAPIQSDPPGIQTGVPNRVQAASLSELSQLVGFDVEELEFLPFDVVETQYTAYQNELAEVTYLGENQTLIFRKLPSSSDPSGDYTDYSDTLILELGLGSVTLRGESGTYVLAAWQDGTYAYSMKSSQPWSQEQWMELLAAIG